MTNIEKIRELQANIFSQLSPLVDRDYWLLEVPYYTNIGDILIWQGTLDFLKTLPYKCKGMYSLQSFRNRTIPENDLILFQGGGNFGDLWNWSHDFRLQVIERCLRNKFIVLPQTVYFEDAANIKRSVDIFSRHPESIICARDKDSYAFLKKHFNNQILLVPDMAFCINMKKWNNLLDFSNKQKKDLLLKRTDKELNNVRLYESLENRNDLDISDWPTMEKDDYCTKWLYRVQSHPRFLHNIQDWYAYHIYRKHLIKVGIKFLDNYNSIYTTRLHGMILSVLLGKRTYVIDNSYGKNSSYYNTWLKDCDNVSIFE